ncbi:MAG: VWA domain-containing protein [Candidatus Entotheonellia bacterium]
MATQEAGTGGVEEIMGRFRYMEWDGSQDPFRIGVDDAMDALADALLRSGDLDWAWQQLLRRGFTSDDGYRSLRGLDDMLREVERKKKELLNKYSPDSFKLDQEQLQRLMQQAQAYMERLQQFMEQLMQRFPQHSEQMGERMEELYQKYQQLKERLRDRLSKRGKGERSRSQRSQSDAYQQLSRMLEQMNRLLSDPRFLENFLQNLDASAADLNSLMQNLDQLSDDQLDQLMNFLEQMEQLEELLNKFAFRGQEMMGMQQGQQILRQMQQMEDLLKFARWGYGDPADMDLEALREVLGQEAHDDMAELQRLRQMLEEAGLLRNTGSGMQLTPAGQRKIGAKALRDIFKEMKKSLFGNHQAILRGASGDRLDETKTYEFGDPFQLDIGQTLKNAVIRQHKGVPIEINPVDFEVYRTELLTRSSTVIMVDLSHSMELYDYNRFTAAKKVALALENLIRTQFPRDKLYIVGFGDYAREVKLGDLPYLSVGPEHTNTQEGLELSRKLLSRESGTNKQIIMITDGRPTAARINGRLFIHTWGLHPAILEETYLAAERCRRSQITINTFMLADDYYLIHFVKEMTRICRGRAFYTTPSRLGEYILVDYINRKRKRIA